MVTTVAEANPAAMPPKMAAATKVTVALTLTGVIEARENTGKCQQS